MVKAHIKGGVWKNSEDEILKAAVMKYGKNQWGRVASLMNRKSAKQCKARWLEWLDPSVKKVEWSRQEEEKLLHLAKIMPAQWKTIGPLVGRTATQCLQHYEQLLDEATGSEARSASQSLEAGQIDSHPETKPARPDPVDMDEDELEMLQEARARLANTQGKKAKRKSRERMLAQAKRLAELQKRRELKQAGLLSGASRKKASKRNRDIDLGVEIPFHKPAPAGFHSTHDEAVKTEQIRKDRIKKVNYHQVNENQYRTRDREAAQSKKREEARLKMLEQTNMKYVVAKVSQKNDPLATRKRGVLELPAPQVSQTEMQQLAKLESASSSLPDHGGMEGHAATQALLGDYTDRPLPTPMRTPASSSSSNAAATHSTLMTQASQLRRLEQGQTPLLGGDAAGVDDNDDGALEGTASHPAAAGATPMMDRKLASRTPLRDELGLNNADDTASVATGFTSIRDLAREERRAVKRARLELQQALDALPAPQFEYELAAPAEDDDNDGDAQMYNVETVQDQADVEAAELDERKREADRLYQARSSVLKRNDLPRPPQAPPCATRNKDDAMGLITAEMQILIEHDAQSFPIEQDASKSKKANNNSKKRKAGVVELESIPQRALDTAREAVMHEFQIQTNGFDWTTVAQACAAASQKGVEGTVYLNGSWIQNATPEQEIEACKQEFQAIREATMAMRKKNDKVSKKLDIKNGGYQKRFTAIQEEVLGNFALTQNAIIERSVFTTLREMELVGATERRQRLENEVASLEENERKEQKIYGDLLMERKRLLAGLGGA